MQVKTIQHPPTQPYFVTFTNSWLSYRIEQLLSFHIHRFAHFLIHKIVKPTYTESWVVHRIWNFLEESSAKICGGLFLGILKGSYETDIDIYINKQSLPNYMQLYNDIHKHFPKNFYFSTQNALTIKLSPLALWDIYLNSPRKASFSISKLQLIRPEICSGTTTSDILQQFDFTVCQIGYDINSQQFTQCVYFDQHFKQQKLFLSPFYPYKPNQKRIQKYLSRGFTV